MESRKGTRALPRRLHGRVSAETATLRSPREMAVMFNRFTWRGRAPAFVACFLLAGACAGCGSRASAPAEDFSWSLGEGPGFCPGPVIHVIAVESPYGSLVRQLGGQGVRYKNIITNPDADPHEFQTNFQVVHDYQFAQLVVENGLGYDSFSDKILETVARKPKVLNAGDLLGLKV